MHYGTTRPPQMVASKSQIIEAMARRDAARAEKLMLEHLDHIESSMTLEPATAEVDLAAIFKG